MTAGGFLTLAGASTTTSTYNPQAPYTTFPDTAVALPIPSQTVSFPFQATMLGSDSLQRTSYVVACSADITEACVQTTYSITVGPSSAGYAPYDILIKAAPTVAIPSDLNQPGKNVAFSLSTGTAATSTFSTHCATAVPSAGPHNTTVNLLSDCIGSVGSPLGKEAVPSPVNPQFTVTQVTVIEAHETPDPAYVAPSMGTTTNGAWKASVTAGLGAALGVIAVIGAVA